MHPVTAEQVPTWLFRVPQTIILTPLSPAEGRSRHQGKPACWGAACLRQPLRRPGRGAAGTQGGKGGLDPSKRDSEPVRTLNGSTPISKAWCRLQIAKPRHPVLLSCRTRDQAAQGTDKHSSARQERGERTGLLASRPSVVWLSLKSKAGASDTASSTLAPAEYSPVATANATMNWSPLEQNPSSPPPLSFKENQVGRKQNQLSIPRKGLVPSR